MLCIGTGFGKTACAIASFDTAAKGIPSSFFVGLMVIPPAISTQVLGEFTRMSEKLSCKFKVRFFTSDEVIGGDLLLWLQNACDNNEKCVALIGKYTLCTAKKQLSIVFAHVGIDMLVVDEADFVSFDDTSFSNSIQFIAGLCSKVLLMSATIFSSSDTERQLFNMLIVLCNSRFYSFIYDADHSTRLSLFKLLCVNVSESVKLASTSAAYVVHTRLSPTLTDKFVNAFGQLEVIKRLSYSPLAIKEKSKDIVAAAMGLFSTNPLSQLVIYAYHHMTIDVIRACLMAVFRDKTVLVIDGRTSDSERQERLQTLDSGNWTFLILSIKVGGAGLSINSPLALASVMVETPSISGDERQAFGRLTRGFERDGVLKQVRFMSPLEHRNGELFDEREQDGFHIHGRTEATVKTMPNAEVPIQYLSYRDVAALYSKISKTEVLVQGKVSGGMQAGLVLIPQLSTLPPNVVYTDIDQEAFVFDQDNFDAFVRIIDDLDTSKDLDTSQEKRVSESDGVTAGALLLLSAGEVRPPPVDAPGDSSFSSTVTSSTGDTAPSGKGKQKSKGNNYAVPTKKAKSAIQEAVPLEKCKLFYVFFGYMNNKDLIFECVFDLVDVGWGYELEQLVRLFPSDAPREILHYMKRVDTTRRMQIRDGMNEKNKATATEIGLMAILETPNDNPDCSYYHYNESDWLGFNHRQRAKFEKNFKWIDFDAAKLQSDKRLRKRASSK